MASRKEILIETIIKNNETSSSDSSDILTSDTSSGEEFIHHANIKTFIDTISQYDNVDFKKHFRLSRHTAEILIEAYKSSPICPNHQHGGREKIGGEREIFVFLWYYISNTVTYRQLGNLFGIAEKSAWTIVNRVASWLFEIADQYIKWPRTPQEIHASASGFERMRGFTGVLGAIDGPHIQIKAPSKNHHLFCNRKKYFSIILQAVIDSRKKFIGVYCGEPDSLHDSRVLRRSLLYEKATQEYESYFPNNAYLLGDSAYPSKKWLVTPFKNTGNLSETNRQFNYLHSSTRIVVENAFGLLKTRFRRLLHFTQNTNMRNVVNITIACCVLHNLCVDENDFCEDTKEPSDSAEELLEDDPPTTRTVNNNERLNDRRLSLVNELLNIGILH